jgi:menaquinone-dependent protoporphyrinogen oxidase
LSTQILVAHASKYGATAEIAEKVGEQLRQAGLTVDVKEAKDIKDLSPYNAVVLGSAVYMGRWLKQASKFLKANRQALTGKPVWIFSSGPTGEGDPVELLRGWQYPGSLKDTLDQIKPREVVVFHGSVDMEKISGIEKRILKNVGAKIGDFRDWEAIQAWGKTIANELQ